MIIVQPEAIIKFNQLQGIFFLVENYINIKIYMNKLQKLFMVHLRHHLSNAALYTFFS